MGYNMQNEMDHIHFQGGQPLEFGLASHWDTAGIGSPGPVYDASPTEPIGALLSDLGPIALADLDAELNGGTPGDHLHTAISTRTGPFFDWYRGLIDPMVRTPAQTATIKAQFAARLRRLLAMATAR